MNCDTCAHWNKENEICGSCLKQACNASNYPDPKPDEMWVEKSIDSYIVTGPKFSCIHHEPK